MLTSDDISTQLDKVRPCMLLECTVLKQQNNRTLWRVKPFEFSVFVKLERQFSKTLLSVGFSCLSYPHKTKSSSFTIVRMTKVSFFTDFAYELGIMTASLTWQYICYVKWDRGACLVRELTTRAGGPSHPE